MVRKPKFSKITKNKYVLIENKRKFPIQAGGSGGGVRKSQNNFFSTSCANLFFLPPPCNCPSLVPCVTNPGPMALPTWSNATPQPQTTSSGSHLLETTCSASSGGNHHPAPLGPTRTLTEPWALSEWPNMATATPSHDRNEGNDEGKHPVGVLKGKAVHGLETPLMCLRSSWMGKTPNLTNVRSIEPY